MQGVTVLDQQINPGQVLLAIGLTAFTLHHILNIDAFLEQFGKKAFKHGKVKRSSAMA